MSQTESGDAMSAPPPNPMMAIPVAMPGLSGNHLMSVETGEMYPSPRPMPPITPEPSHSIQSWCMTTPSAEMRRPPHQQSAATTPALRGPACSSHPPQIAAAEPRNTKKSVYIQPSMLIFQSQDVVNTVAMKDMSAGHATDLLIPIARDNGS